MRIWIFLTLILFRSISFAQVEDLNWYDSLRTWIGGGSNCIQGTTFSNAERLDQDLCGTKFTRPVRQLQATAANLEEEILFQEVTRRSHQSSQCHKDALGLYATNGERRAAFNNWANDAFNSVKDEIAFYVEEIAALRSENSTIRSTFDRQDYSTAQANLRRRVALNEEQIGKYNLAIKGLAAKIPLGNHAPIREAVQELLADPSLTADNANPANVKARFLSVYEGAVRKLKSSIDESVAFYDGKRNTAGNYQVDDAMKVALHNSGQVSTLLEGIAERSTDPAMKNYYINGLSCRMNANYKNGNTTVEIIKNVGLAGLTIFAAEVTLPIKAGAALISASSTVARLSYLGADFTTGLIRGLSIHGMYRMNFNDMINQCAGPSMLVNGQEPTQCEAGSRLNGMLQEASNADCATSVLFNVAPDLVAMRTAFMRSARGLRLNRAAASAESTEVEEIVVVGQRSRSAQGAGDAPTPAGTTRASRTERSGARGSDVEVASATPSPSPVVRAVRDRRELTDRYLNRNFSTPAQNRRWLEIAENTPPGTSARFLEIENASMKILNDTTLDKNFVTALTNKHKEMITDAIKDLQRRYPNVEFSIYSDFKSVRYAIRPKPPATSLPAALEADIASAFARANNEFSSFLRERNISPQGRPPNEWFRAGYAETADEATSAARYARRLDNNAMARFNDEGVQTRLEADRVSVQNDQRTLESTLQADLLEPVSEGSARMIPRREIFDGVRKTSTDDELVRFIQASTGRRVTTAQAADIRRYVDGVDNFSPSINVIDRQVASLADSDHGGFSIDFAGLGSFNGQATARAIAESGNLRSAIQASRQGERGVTAAFRERIESVQEGIQAVLRIHNIQAEIMISGDDMVVRPSRAIPESVRAEIAAELARKVEPSSIRLSHVGDDVVDGNERMLMATLGENCEKKIRRRVREVLGPQRVDNMMMMVEVSGQGVSSFSGNLVLSSDRRSSISASDRSQVQSIATQVFAAGCQ